MRKGLFYILIALISIGIILLNTVDSIKYLTCEDPANYTIIVEEVKETEIELTITTFSSGETFSSYEYHIDGDTLYVGAKFALNPLTDNATGTHTFTIDTEERINVIYAKGGTEEVKVFPTD